MEEEQNTPAQPQRWAGRRGASTAAAAAILIVVIVVVGAGGYFGLNAAAPASTAGSHSTGTTSTCQPVTSPYCKAKTPTSVNDVVLTVPYQAGFGQSIGQVVQGLSVPASLSVTGHESVNTWTVNWGDGSTPTTSTSPLISHTYNGLGTYAISGTATVGTATHTGTTYLFPISVVPSITTTTAGSYPTIAATLSNGTGSSTFNEPWVQGTGTFTVSAAYTQAPATGTWVPQTTSLIVSPTTGGTLTTTTATASGASGTFAVNTPGEYTITMVGPILNTVSGVTIWQNYTWGVYSSPSSLPAACTSCKVSGSSSGIKDPHPGTIDSYEVIPGGATSIDPAVDYESVGYEVLANIYQTLVYYNGSSSASFLPEIATCVPGTAECSTLYGSSLIVNNATTGNPQYWTFVIDKNANYYDPSTGAHWGVYPTDVMASLARTAGFADLPFYGANPGWIQSQSFLNIGSPTFDSAMHYPYNNTGANILSAMLINDSTYCPAAAMSGEHGCITFNAWGAGSDWPFFLELVSDPDGGAIEPCGWYGYEGAGAPGFTTTAAKGDGPCLLPDGQNTTNNKDGTLTTAWSSYLASITPESSTGFKAWDSFEAAASLTPAVYPSVRFAGVGSGPYYLASLTRGVGYVLGANPYYNQPNCAADSWCQPAPGNYASTVNTFWEPTDQVGIQEYIQGKADFAGIESQDTSTLLNLEATGKVGLLPVPTISIFFDPINFGVNVGSIDQYYTGSVHLPSNATGSSNFFSYVALRQFLVNAFPYTQDIDQVVTVDGIQGGFNYGGAIPHFMGNYYPTNVSWPSGQPDTNPADVGGAAWWWAQANDPTSVYYDNLLAQCTVANPCTFPVIGAQADTIQDGQFPIWASWISQLTGGRITFTEVDLTFSQEVVYAESSTPFTNPMTIYVLGWLPDYPDPTDYVAPMYLPDATYTAPDAVFEGLANDTACAAEGGDTFANLSYWAQQQGVPQYCQGTAYGVMTWANHYAGALPVGPERVLYYNLASHIANDLALYLYQFQEEIVFTYAPWINPSTIDSNVVAAGEELNCYIQGNGLV